MAVTLVSTPDLFALTKGGRMLYQFSGSGRYETTGVKAVTAILFSTVTPVTDGVQIPLTWNGQTVIMTARTTPTQAGEFPAGDGSPAYVQSILPYFKGYFPIRQDFVVTADLGPPISLIVLTAKRPGAAYTILPFATAPSFSIGAPTPAGADPIIRARYGVYVEVYLQAPGTTGDSEDDFVLVGAGQHVEADEDGNMQFDVGDLLHGYLSEDTPPFNSTGGQTCQTSHRKYFIAYGEAWGNPIKPQLIVADTTRHAYLGGADFEHRADGGFSLDNFLKGNGSDEDRALRFGPSTRRIYVDEPAWLTFINLRVAAPDGVYARVKLTFDDGSNHTSTTPQIIVPFGVGDKLCVPVGITQLDLLNQVTPGQFLKEYTVTLRDTGGTDYSLTYRYIVDYDQRPYQRLFVYQNSLGAFDCLSTWGKGSAELQRFSDQAERSLPAFYSPTAGQFVDYNVSRQQSFEVASGWQPQGELARWDDFYCSYVRYQVSGSKVLAIGLTSKSIKQHKDGDTQFAHSFTYVLLHRDEYYTEDVLAGEEAVPSIAVPAGIVSIQPTVSVLTRDPTVPDVVRGLTVSDINSFKTVAARPNPATLGFLTEQAGSTVFRRQDRQISFITDLSEKPSTLEAAGLGNDYVAKTHQFIQTLIGIRPRLRSWTGDEKPA